MHEHHIVEKICNDAIILAKRKNASKVTKIFLTIGELKGLEESSVKLYFENLSDGTILEGAELFINYIKPELRCPKCGKNFLKEKKSFNCPICQTEGAPTEIGKELFIEKIETN